MNQIALDALEMAKSIRSDVPLRYVPPSEGTLPQMDGVVPRSIAANTRGYIERVVHQINGCYEKGWFDACAVMMRRLLETLIIESYEAYGIADKIKDKSTGDFFYLSRLIPCLLNEPLWNIGRNSRRALPRLKDIGDKSAHSRRFVAHREDIDRIADDFRVVYQELVFLAKLK